MATDLIPPPSPAGRPEPDSSESADRIAEGLWSGGERSPRRVSLPPPGGDATTRPPVDSPYRSRFGFVVGALIGVALATVGLGTMLALNASTDGAPDGWSSWRPSGEDELVVAKQVAEYVGVNYRLGDLDQLVAVRSSAMELDGRPFGVALRTAAVGGDIELVDGRGVMFTLDGLGENGSIPGGKPSKERMLLLKREALELALYTFRYVDDVDSVVTFLPPRVDATAGNNQNSPQNALFFRKSQYENFTEEPLVDTLPGTPDATNSSASQSRVVDRLTLPALFRYQLQRSPDGGNSVLVLSPAATG